MQISKKLQGPARRRLSFEGLEDRRMLAIDPRLLGDIYLGSQASDPSEFTSAGGMTFFTAENAVNGRELWVTDGTPGGTAMVEDIFPGSESSDPSELTRVGNSVFFSAGDQAGNRELWQSDGTPAGTFVVEIQPGTTGSDPTGLTNFQGLLYCAADDGTNGQQIWRSNGSLLDTQRVTSLDLTGPIEDLTVAGQTLFFTATDAAHGHEPWKTDGTSAGTTMLADVRSSTGTGSSPEQLTAVGSSLFFVADDGLRGAELWSSDGTTGGTSRVADVFPGTTGSSIHDMVDVGGVLYFGANDGSVGDELWRSDGTGSGTTLVVDLNPGFDDADIGLITAVSDEVYFSATDETGVDAGLWRTDGTVAGTSEVSERTPEDLAAYNDLAFFAADGSLWMTDGTLAGTIAATPTGSIPLWSVREMVVAEDRLFFTADDTTRGHEPWVLATRIPQAVDDAYAVDHHQSLVVAVGEGVLSNDIGDPAEFGGATLEAVVDDGPSHGVLTPAADGSFTYAPEWGFSGQDQFTYHIDTGLLTSAMATVVIDVRFVDHLDFRSPVDGMLFVSGQGGIAPGQVTELGFGTSYDTHHARLTGLPDTTGEVFAGFMRTDQLLRLSLKTVTAGVSSYAFSGVNNGPSREAFSDRDDSLTFGGTAVEALGGNTWLLHGDDARYSTLDSDDELLVQFRIDPVTAPDDLGTIGQAELVGLDPSSATVWVELTASMDGILTLETSYAAGDADLKLMTQRGFALDSTGLVTTGGRIDFDATAGETYLLELTGTAGSVDLRATNQVSISGSLLTINGSDTVDDVVLLDTSFAQPLMVNGVDYVLPPTGIRTILFDGGGGSDSVTLLGTAANESAVVGNDSVSGRVVTFQRPGLLVELSRIEDVTVEGGGGSDVGEVFDSPGDDVVELTPTSGSMVGGGFSTLVNGFDTLSAFSSGVGADEVLFHDSPGDDTAWLRLDEGVVQGDGFRLSAEGFRDMTAVADQGGDDRVTLIDTSGDDTFTAWPTEATLVGPGFEHKVELFELVEATATAGGNDTAFLHGSTGDETFSARGTTAQMHGATFAHEIEGFDHITAFGEGGNDVATLVDTSGDDILTTAPGLVTLAIADLYEITVEDFFEVTARAEFGGRDVANMFDSSGDDRFRAAPTRAAMFLPGETHRAENFSRVIARATGGGIDRAKLVGSAGNDILVSSQTRSTLRGDRFFNRAARFENVRANGRRGIDFARLVDTSADDVLTAKDRWAQIARVGLFRYANRFSRVVAISRKGGTDTSDIRAIDFALRTVGDWL